MTISIFSAKDIAASEKEFKLDLVKVKKQIKESRNRKGKLTESEIAGNLRKVRFMKEIVSPQLKDGLSLDLSNNEKNAEKLGCTPREAKRTKEELSKAGVLIVPEETKQKKKGDYPIWFVSFAFLSEMKSTTTGSKKKKKSWLANMDSDFIKIWNDCKKEILDYLESEEVESISADKFFKELNFAVNQEIESLGKTRDDYRL